jgi:ABC-type nitrate/sulfonate/bicarbonate transport system substrate-binding protein
VHYIPVSTDLSDLEQLWRWAEANPDEAQRIAAAGALVGRSQAPRSAARDFSAALSLASARSIQRESVGRRLRHCHYGTCADEEMMACRDYPDHESS